MNKIRFLERDDNKEKFYEVYNASNVAEYCMLNEELNAIHPQVRCKDYIQDLFWMSRLIKKGERDLTDLKEMEIYGFNSYKYCVNYSFVDKDYYRVGIRFRTEGQNFRIFDDMFTSCVIKLLNQLETNFEFPTSEISLNETKDIMMFKFSSKWTEQPYLVSLYLLLIRVLINIDPLKIESIKSFEAYLLEYPKKNAGSDARILNDSTLLLTKFFGKEKIPKQNWEDFKDINDIHNNSGVSSFSKLIKRLEFLKSAKTSEDKVLVTMFDYEH